MNFLYDFYQSLLTEKQRSYMHLYYLDDHSLGEIADEYEISRQAVYDNIRRTEAMLEEYEEKLKLLEKFQQRQLVMNQLQQVIQAEPINQELASELIEMLKESD
ncbi:putative DNA-binding protein [Paenisporosarcina sp.]|uniref:putative DNA-binding protein n=1 Tax=Paenisporosarcina sp. TaxID=1932001 RepID=UPI003C7864C1